jgi:hypothetical protein
VGDPLNTSRRSFIKGVVAVAATPLRAEVSKMTTLNVRDFGIVPGVDIEPGLQKLALALNGQYANQPVDIQFGSNEVLTWSLSNKTSSGDYHGLYLRYFNNSSINFNGSRIEVPINFRDPGLIRFWPITLHNAKQIVIDGYDVRQTYYTKRDFEVGLMGIVLVDDCDGVEIKNSRQYGGPKFVYLNKSFGSHLAPKNITIGSREKPCETYSVFYPTPVNSPSDNVRSYIKAYNPGRAIVPERARNSYFYAESTGLENYNDVVVMVNPDTRDDNTENSIYNIDIEYTAHSVDADDSGTTPDSVVTFVSVLNGGSQGGGASPATMIRDVRLNLNVDAGGVLSGTAIQFGVNEPSHPSPNDPSRAWTIDGVSVKGQVVNFAGQNIVEVKATVQNAPIGNLTFKDLVLSPAQGRTCTFLIEGDYVGPIHFENVSASGVTLTNRSSAVITYGSNVQFAGSAAPQPMPQPQPMPDPVPQPVPQGPQPMPQPMPQQPMPRPARKPCWQFW